MPIACLVRCRVFGTTYRNRQRELMHYRTVCGDASWSLFHNLPVAQHSPGEPIFFVSGRSAHRPLDRASPFSANPTSMITE